MNVRHHFFGKELVIDRELKNRINLKNSLKKQQFCSKHTLLLSQIHSAKVEVVTRKEQIWGEQNLPKADAIVTNLAEISMGIVTADCAPVLLLDREKNIIAALHAGWRGAKLGIIANVLKEMKKLGAGNITAIIGPMIQQRSYEVSQDFLDEFLKEDPKNKIFFKDKKIPEKYLFDLNAYVEAKLKQSLVSKIINEKIDTYENEDKYFSYRRTTHKNEPDCGRNISVIEIG